MKRGYEGFAEHPVSAGSAMGRGKKAVLCIVMAVITLISVSGGTILADSSASSENLIQIGGCSAIDSLNPFVAYTAEAYEVFLLTYDTLTKFDKDMQTVPSLAKSWESSDDGLTWTYHLRDDVKWSDGEKFTSADVKFSYNAYLDNNASMYVTFLNNIDSIETPDDYTVVIHTSSPKADMLAINAPILPEHIWGKMTADELTSYDNADCVGTGCYQLVEWKKGESCLLKANKEYFAGAPAADGVVFKQFATTDNLTQALKQGEIDIALSLSSSDVKGLEKQSNITTYYSVSNEFTELAFNCKADGDSKGNPALLKKDVRQAIEYAINKDEIVKLAYSGDGVSAYSLLPASEKKWHYEPTADETHAYNVDKANALLDAAGYDKKNSDGIRLDENGDPLTFSLISRKDSAGGIKAGEMIKSYLEKIGIGVKLEVLDDGALNDRIFGGADFDMFIWGWVGDVDPSTLLGVLTTSNIDNLNDVYYSNTDYDALVEKQATILDLKERQQAVYDAQKILLDEVPYCLLSYVGSYTAVRSDLLTGITPINNLIFGSSCFDNYLTATTKDAAKGEKTLLWIGIGAGVVVIAAVLVTVIVVKKKKSGNEDEE